MGWHFPPMRRPSASVWQLNPTSCSQVSVHPSPDARDQAPSSHSSPASATRTPSPHSPEHTSYEASVLPTQYHPSSTTQLALHPSPAAVLLSSHSSGKTRTPSPQSVEHPFSSHLKPVSSWQPLHPSKLASLPSSHSSLPTTSPSPQMGVHGAAREPPGGQSHPISTRHPSHPSPAAQLPSSHCPSMCTTTRASPHVSEHSSTPNPSKLPAQCTRVPLTTEKTLETLLHSWG
mmetsp:Transcript_7898/g.20302  ORF Transcript_7898/g.20302 Transcript_7898/m.20302 type:complete len:232 (+) Transcript_7898:504-1199(+)